MTFISLEAKLSISETAVNMNLLAPEVPIPNLLKENLPLEATYPSRFN